MGRSGLKTYVDQADFTCNTVLDAANLNTLRDNIISVRQSGDTVFSCSGGNGRGIQQTVIGYDGGIDYRLIDGDGSYYLNLFKGTLTEELVFENPGYDRYVLNIKFRLVDVNTSTGIVDADFLKTLGYGINLKQNIKIEYYPSSGSSQFLLDTSVTSFGTFTGNTIYTQEFQGSITVPPPTGTTEQCTLRLILTNISEAGATVINEDEAFRIADPDKWGGIASISLRLHN